MLKYGIIKNCEVNDLRGKNVCDSSELNFKIK